MTGSSVSGQSTRKKDGQTPGERGEYPDAPSGSSRRKSLRNTAVRMFIHEQLREGKDIWRTHSI